MKPARRFRFPGDADLVVRVAEVHVVEKVLRLDAELQVDAGRETEALEERGVHVPEPRAARLVAPEVAEGAAGGPAEGAARGPDGNDVEVGCRPSVPLPTAGITERSGRPGPVSRSARGRGIFTLKGGPLMR